jgi:hypothetical protein
MGAVHASDEIEPHAAARPMQATLYIHWDRLLRPLALSRFLLKPSFVLPSSLSTIFCTVAFFLFVPSHISAGGKDVLYEWVFIYTAGISIPDFYGVEILTCAFRKVCFGVFAPAESGL